MTQYALIKNNEIVIAPRNWNVDIFTAELSKNNVYVSLSSREPDDVLIWNDILIVPVIDNTPLYDSHYQDLQGPTYIINNHEVSINYTVVSKSLDLLKNSLKASVIQLRDVKESSGIALNGNLVSTSEASQVKLASAKAYFDIDTEATSIDWNLPSGDFINLTKNDVIGMGIAIGRYIAGCSTTAKNIISQINATTTVEELKVINIDTGWPENNLSSLPQNNQPNPNMPRMHN